MLLISRETSFLLIIIPTPSRNKLSASHGSLAAYDGLKDFIDHKYVRNNAYATVSLDKIFQGLFSAGAL
jgi:hypothetical protein